MNRPVDVAVIGVAVQRGVVFFDDASDFLLITALGHLKELLDVVPLKPDRVEVFAGLDPIIYETVYPHIARRIPHPCRPTCSA